MEPRNDLRHRHLTHRLQSPDRPERGEAGGKSDGPNDPAIRRIIPGASRRCVERRTCGVDCNNRKRQNNERKQTYWRGESAVAGEHPQRKTADELGHDARVLSGLSIANLITYLTSGGVLVWGLGVALDIRDTATRSSFDVAEARKTIDAHNTEFDKLRERVRRDEQAVARYSVHINDLIARVQTLEQARYGGRVDGHK